jgi:hypothetical protein
MGSPDRVPSETLRATAVVAVFIGGLGSMLTFVLPRYGPTPEGEVPDRGDPRPEPAAHG